MQCILKFNEVSVFAQLNCFQIQVKILVVRCCCGQEVAALLCGYFLPGVMCVHLINFNSLKMFGRSSGHTHPGKRELWPSIKYARLRSARVGNLKWAAGKLTGRHSNRICLEWVALDGMAGLVGVWWLIEMPSAECQSSMAATKEDWMNFPYKYISKQEPTIVLWARIVL